MSHEKNYTKPCSYDSMVELERTNEKILPICKHLEDNGIDFMFFCGDSYFSRATAVYRGTRIYFLLEEMIREETREDIKLFLTHIQMSVSKLLGDRIVMYADTITRHYRHPEQMERSEARMEELIGRLFHGPFSVPKTMTQLPNERPPRNELEGPDAQAASPKPR